ncbi:MAG: hypothetical protein DRG11_05685 [Epsilonproteobacteria bacterium]|nr:MAG: hypothetical protein B1H07_04595 [Campylobacteraceae bacterium 4484_166]RLA74191.1 MAG: hypothetical protein DRG11_05685 [Campylobacterota bacterium]
MTKKNIIKLKTSKAVFSNISGSHNSMISGDGLDFKDIRQYNTSDDIRHINWSVTSRTNEVAINIFNETKQLDVSLIYLNSSSMQFGSNIAKFDIVYDCVAILGLSLFKSNDSLTTIFYNQGENKFYHKTTDRRVLPNILKDIETLNKKDINNNLQTYLMNKIKKRTLMVIVGDFLQPIELKLLSKKHDLRVIIVRDKLEEQLKFTGELNFQQFSTNSLLSTNIDTKAIHQYNKHMKKHDDSLVRYFKKNKIKHQKIYTYDNVLKKLQKFFQ